MDYTIAFDEGNVEVLLDGIEVYVAATRAEAHEWIEENS